VAIAAGNDHCLGLKADGSIVAWGANYFGQTDVPVHNTGFVAVAAGWFHSLGLKADGSIVAWGDDSAGQANVPAPNMGFVAIAGGGEHSVGLKGVSSGDFDLDSDVDLVDLGVFNRCQADPHMIPMPFAPLTTARCLGVFDLVRDGHIDMVDFAEMQNLFTMHQP
jgi:hypothetical protein